MKKIALYLSFAVIIVGIFTASSYFLMNNDSIEYITDSLYLSKKIYPKDCFFVKDTTLTLDYRDIKTSYPPEGYIPNEEIAAKIAETVWVSVYGERIYSQKPYCVNLIKDSIWVVNGSVPGGGYGENAYIEIRKKDGRILKVLMGC